MPRGNGKAGSGLSGPMDGGWIDFWPFNEGEILRQELAGYSEYCLGTRFRLILFV
jgi:hypothetical protein